MKEFVISKLSELDVRCYRNLNKYVDFCLSNNMSNTEGLTYDRHHILPRATFKQFENLTNNPWNVSNLTPENHYIAHALLHLAIKNYSFASAWYAMNNKNRRLYDGESLLGPELYGSLIRKRNKQCSEAAKRLVIAKNLTTGEISKIPREEFLLDENLAGHTIGTGGEHLRGTITAVIDGVARRIPKEDFNTDIHHGINIGKTNFRDSDGAVYMIESSDPRVLSGELKHVSTDLAVYYDSSGKRVTTFNYDPRVLSGELTHIHKGRTLYRHKDSGEIKSLFYDDPRVLSSEYVGINKGIVKCQDSEGNIFRVHKEDPRVVSGELIRLTKDVEKSVSRNRTLIYNNQDELMFDCRNNFGKICKENNLPIALLRETAKNNTKIISANTGNSKYDGWYARKGLFE